MGMNASNEKLRTRDYAVAIIFVAGLIAGAVGFMQMLEGLK